MQATSTLVLLNEIWTANTVFVILTNAFDCASSRSDQNQLNQSKYQVLLNPFFSPNLICHTFTAFCIWHIKIH